MKKLWAVFSKFYKKLNPREKKIFFATVMIIGILVTDRLLVRPSFQLITKLEKSILDEEAAIRNSVYVLNKKRNIQQEAKELAAYASDVTDPEEEMTSLLKAVEALTNQAGVNLVYVKPGVVKEAPGMKKFYSTLELESEMEQISTLFHSIESSPKFFKIEKYEIEPKAKDSSLARCALTVSKTALL